MVTCYALLIVAIEFFWFGFRFWLMLRFGFLWVLVLLLCCWSFKWELIVCDDCFDFVVVSFGLGCSSCDDVWMFVILFCKLFVKVLGLFVGWACC